ncbi:hypothetical protein [Pontibacter chinhatensis]|uniref:Uncharacterized protein n=1 Tax=Pontibacter chinhatensis TaxID=1436961 RepID=A0A1I2ZNA4_9BACT|nr:hypothetical protein [Pontibacter chinhatensis]SFH39125.1 hypothetical protein SAMN05421739_11617 [Pontibacter chinhatensis]
MTQQLDALFSYGKCTYTTMYRDYNFAVTLRCVPRVEQFYNYIFPASQIEENIYKMLDDYLTHKENGSFVAAMFEDIVPNDIPVFALPVMQINTLEISISALRNVDCYTSGSDISTSFNSFKG